MGRGEKDYAARAIAAHAMWCYEADGKGAKAARREARLRTALEGKSFPDNRGPEILLRAQGVINPHEAITSPLVADIPVRSNNVINPHD